MLMVHMICLRICECQAGITTWLQRGKWWKTENGLQTHQAAPSKCVEIRVSNIWENKIKREGMCYCTTKPPQKHKKLLHAEPTYFREERPPFWFRVLLIQIQCGVAKFRVGAWLPRERLLKDAVLGVCEHGTGERSIWFGRAERLERT
jgi:hypothetical protein